MEIHFTVSIIFALATTLTYAASFDCNKASKTICNDQLLSKLDDTLSENYNYMPASNIVGVRERKYLKAISYLGFVPKSRNTIPGC